MGQSTLLTKRDRIIALPSMRSALSDVWLPKYRRAVEKELKRQVRAAAGFVRAGAPINRDELEWTERLMQVQRPYALEMALEGYKLGEAEFGKSKNLDELYAKALTEAPAVTLAFGPESEELLLRKLRPAVEQWLETRTKTVTGTMLESMASTVKRDMAEGFTIGEITTDLELVYGQQARWRAERVARSATIWNYNEGAQQFYADSGVGVKEWFVTTDDMLCEFCEPMDGRQVLMAESFASGGASMVGNEGGSLDTEFDIEHPPLHPNCVVGETPVVAPDKVAAFVTAYSGPIVDIVIADGRRLSVTPNHMLLTPWGFVTAASLRKGDDVLNSSVLQRIVARHPNDNCDPAAICQVVGALAKSAGMSARRVPVTSEYLHRDAAFCDGEIDVIAPDSFLRGGHNALFPQLGSKQQLAPPDADLPRFARCGPFAASLIRLARTADSIMGSRRESFAFLGRRAGHAGEHGLATVARCDSAVNEQAADSASRALAMLRKSFDGHSSHVSLANVVDIKHRAFTGHVYDLQTFSSLYTCNGLVSSNCRCVLLPVM